MHSPRLFSPEVSADLDTIASATATCATVVDAAALTVLAGVIGQRVSVYGAGGAPTPLSLLTAVLVPPVAEALSLATQLTAPLEAAEQELVESFGSTPQESARLRLKYAEQEIDMMNRIDPQVDKVTELKQRLREAELVAGTRILFHDPEFMALEACLERAHHRALLTCFSSDHLVDELGSHREVLAQFLRWGANSQLSLKNAPDTGYAITTLAVLRGSAFQILPSLRTRGNQVVPFMAIDGPAEFGAQAFAPRPELRAWPALVRGFLHERLHGKLRVLGLPPDTHVHVNALLNEVVEPAAAGNPGIAPFLAPATTVLLRTAALVALTENMGATAVSASALSAAYAFTRPWVESHARLLAVQVPPASGIKKPVVVRPPDFGVDRALLIDHLHRRTGERWRNIKMNLPKGRASGYWEHVLTVLKVNAIVRIGPKHVVTLNPPPPGCTPAEFYGTLPVFTAESDEANLWVPTNDEATNSLRPSSGPAAPDELTGPVDLSIDAFDRQFSEDYMR